MKKIILFLCLFSLSISVYAQLNGSNFYRIRNVSQSADYLKIVNDSIDAQRIVGSASSVANDEGEAAMGRVADYLDIDIKTTNNNIFTDPGTIIYLEKSDEGVRDYDIIGQGIGLKYISSCIFVGTSAGALTLDGLYATLEGSNPYTAKIKLYKKVSMFGISGTVDQTRYIGENNNRKVSLYTSNTENDCKWYIEPINTNNYFAAAPLSTLNQNNNYYTSLRTAFSYTIPSESNVNAYKVTALPNDDGGLATLEKINITTNDVILAGLPVIIESAKLNSEDNKLNPCTPIIKSITSYNTGSAISYIEKWGIQIPVQVTTITSSNISFDPDPLPVDDYNILYNNYGRHGHDNYTADTHKSGFGAGLTPGWLPEGNNIGFFKNKYNYGVRPTIYKLGMYHGAVGFWGEALTATDEVSGNEAYSPKRCQLFPVEKDLADISVEGKTYEDITYKVSKPLTVAHIDLERKVIFANDGNGAVPQTGENDFMNDNYNNKSHEDHSNWVEIHVSSVPSGLIVNDKIDVQGKVINGANRTITGKAEKNESFTEDYTFTPNTYCIANFSTDQKGYFFATPQPNEVCNIIWAMWDANSERFIVPDKAQNEHGDFSNGPGFEGSIQANFDYYDGTFPQLIDKHVYSFKALVRKNGSQAAPMLKADSDEFILYPLSDGNDDGHMQGDVYTNIGTVDTRNVSGVTYYNSMGMASDTPFKGINIVVTSYDNGTKTTKKVIK